MIAFLFRLVLICSTALLTAQTRVTVLVTTDMHGAILPVDYFTGRPAARGLAKLATVIGAARAANPNTLLIDCGDTIQGSPMEYVYQSYVRAGKFPLGLEGPPLRHDPMMLVMNHLHYDAMTVGNHEYNYGLENLRRARADAEFPWLSANTSVSAGVRARGGEKPYAPYVVKQVGAVKVAVIGITTPVIPIWEKPENIGAYRFAPGVAAARRAVEELRAKQKPDLIVAAVHAGVDRDLNAPGAVGSNAEEDMVYQIAEQVAGIDAIAFGHTHREVKEARVNGVLLVQPKNWAMSLGELDFTLVKREGSWQVTEKRARTIPVTAETAVDGEIVKIAEPYERITQRYLDRVIAHSDASLDGSLGRVEDIALLDAVQTVQLHYAKADVSFSSMFNPRVAVPKGPVTVRQIAALYVYDNELYAIEGDGKLVKDALENAARYFLTCRDAECALPLRNPKVFPFNFDIAQGVSYEIDLSKPEGSRIINLRFRGEALDPARKLRIAVNNYRAGGSAGYEMFAKAKILWRSGEEIRDLIIRYYTEHKALPVNSDGNWRIVPEPAYRNVKKEALADRGPNLM